MFAVSRLAFALGSAALAAAPQEGEGLKPLLDFYKGAWIWTWIAFIVALPVMWKMVYGPITRALTDRDQKVEDAVAAAETARKDAEQRMAEAKAELDKARAEGRRMVEEAVARAERQAAAAAQAAAAKAKAELQKARDAIAAEKRAALQEIRQEAVGLTIAATARLLHKELDDEAHRRLVKEFVAGTGTGTGTGTGGERR